MFIFTDTDEAGAVNALENIRDILNNAPLNINGSEIHVTSPFVEQTKHFTMPKIMVEIACVNFRRLAPPLFQKNKPISLFKSVGITDFTQN